MQTGIKIFKVYVIEALLRPLCAWHFGLGLALGTRFYNTAETKALGHTSQLVCRVTTGMFSLFQQEMSVLTELMFYSVIDKSQRRRQVHV